MKITEKSGSRSEHARRGFFFSGKIVFYLFQTGIESLLTDPPKTYIYIFVALSKPQPCFGCDGYEIYEFDGDATL